MRAALHRNTKEPSSELWMTPKGSGQKWAMNSSGPNPGTGCWTTATRPLLNGKGALGLIEESFIGECKRQASGSAICVVALVQCSRT